ncbi:hypothetical protein SEPCBS119000_005790 [Sporothrix epigloea]|uniref:DJ-1/PfpI domain-containing protein n=1 Tax=Sporothrix epigloea TaxID=1892477 RepID=A0ABP0DZU0_9PEZI
MAEKTSTATDHPVLQVLFALHPKFDLVDLAGPLEAFTWAQHDMKDVTTKAFKLNVAGAGSSLMSNQGIAIEPTLTYEEAYERLDEFDVLVVVGGRTDEVIAKRTEPCGVIEKYVDLQKNNPDRERTLLSICTGSLILGELGVLAGLSATTHSFAMTTFENICSKAATRDLDERTDIIEDARYVVNNLRFDLGDEDSNPYIRRNSDTRRPSNARKGSVSLKDSRRRESVTRRAAMRLGGMRVITSGGISAGVDATLYLISALVSEDAAKGSASVLQWTWTKGVVVNGLDV